MNEEIWNDFFPCLEEQEQEKEKNEIKKNIKK